MECPEIKDIIKNINLPALHLQSGIGEDLEERASIKRRQMAILVLLAIVSTCSAESISIFSPYHHKLAEDKGYTPSEYGIVLSSNSLIMFLLTPIIGKHVQVIGVKLTFTLGMFIIGISSTVTGFQHMFSAGAVFLFMSTAVRIIHAFGNAIVVTSTFAIMGAEFPNSVAKVFGMTRLFMQIGYLIGPILGGLLHELGGPGLPFMVLGCLHCNIAVVAFHFNPDYKVPDADPLKIAKPVSISSILLTPGVWIAFGCFVVGSFTNGFLSVALKPQIPKQFALDPSVLSAVFIIKDFIAGIVAPIWGYLGDKAKFRKPIIAIGAATAGSALLILNQFSGESFDHAPWLIVVGLILCAIGTSGEQVIAFVDSVRHLTKQGYADEIKLHGCLAGLWSSCCELGKFLALSLSGILVDNYGFNKATAMVSGLNLLLAMVTIIYLTAKSGCSQRDRSGEREPLLSTKNRTYLALETHYYEAIETHSMV